ncbi:hypothetical protein B0H10DRAFT_2095539 [Mycena sp. CBHHK59/15]|nr:hypothetical protein B0H10DRAFT_2095539 [Mycena sp. CBHHK59/15]
MDATELPIPSSPLDAAPTSRRSPWPPQPFSPEAPTALMAPLVADRQGPL